MPEFNDFYKARNIITEILRKDLIGPVEPNEVLAESPAQYYIMGKLYPKKQNDEADDILDMAQTPLLENESGSFDSVISLSNVQNPSSMGITVCLLPEISEIRIMAEYAFYKPVSAEGKPEKLWIRNEHKINKIYQIKMNKTANYELERGIGLHIYSHRKKINDANIITVSMINNNVEDSDYTNRIMNTAFQVKITVSGAENANIFSEINNLNGISESDDLDLLYSDFKCYAQGHGCSVQWDRDASEPKWISSEYLPFYTLKQMKASEFNGFKIFDMEYLGKGDPDSILIELRKFNNLYYEWILKLEKSIASLADNLKLSAKNNIEKCKMVYKQIGKTIESLGKDNKAFQAFQLANEAMFMQRKQTIIKSKGYYNPDEEKIAWFPFQLSYILHEIISFTKPESPERNNVDLLWFPTGGGKTEAYLGISAFVLFYRRLLINAANDGVIIIMRYTLRLLTIQQFERASMLIMACELLRKKNKIGNEKQKFSIGLWVGSKLTPNSLSVAKTNLNKLQRNPENEMEDENPCQLKLCPWCGKNLYPENYAVKEDIKRLVISCPNKNCDFHAFPDGLPVHLIDDAIYQHLPCFIIATIDKFAQIPLSDKPAALFGITNGKNPPELIIQDELHLISGPLGTMTGIYEAAVTEFCKKDDIPVKIIASTATIKYANKQILSLYGREHTQFPPQGITINDSFFAGIAEEDEKAARQYFGVMGIGTTATTTLIRVNAALLFAARYLEKIDMPEKVIDNFWTIIGYFNSLRELGGASTQIIDDVQSRFSYLAKTKFSKSYPGVDPDKKYDHMEELTSRMNNTAISKIIQEGMKKSYNKKGNNVDVYDFILASNMISVGIDIDRLGLMAVAGQPKSNSEYIQTTSRIGRKNPGLVITVYNGSRSRDRSHYEQFQKYHSALYRYVEATSITPFSERARDRGLHALFVAFCRYKISDLLKNDQAVKFKKDDKKVKDIIDYLVDYIRKADNLVDSAELEKEFLNIASEWEHRTTGGLIYKEYYSNKKMLLKNDISQDRFRTMNSLRNVDPESGIYLHGGY